MLPPTGLCYAHPWLQGIPAVDDTWLAGEHDDERPQGDIPNCAGASGP